MKTNIKEILRNMEHGTAYVKNVRNYVEEPKKRVYLLSEKALARRNQLMKIKKEISDLSSLTSSRSVTSQNGIAALRATMSIQKNPRIERIKGKRELMKRFPMQNKQK